MAGKFTGDGEGCPEKIGGEDGDDGGAAVRRRRRQLEDGGVAKRTVKYPWGKEWRLGFVDLSGLP